MATPTATAPALHHDDVAAIDRLRDVHARLKRELARVIIGQEETIERLAICLFARGHALLMGVPGLAKTLLVSKLAECVSLKFSRIQFTPDLMPMDITGTDILQETADGRREFHFVQGPVFANIVLADEINRAPPKTQAALLQAMQERTVTVSGKTYPLPNPFFVLATQNPIEQEGTYHLPEAQLDRFMFELRIGYPTLEEEEAIVATTTGVAGGEITPVMTADQLREMMALVRRLPAPPSLVRYAVGLARATRPKEPEASPAVRKYVAFGAGPRAGQNLVLAAKARAAMDGRSVPDLEDVDAVAFSVLRHRVVLNFQAEAEGMGIEAILALGGRGRSS